MSSQMKKIPARAVVGLAAVALLNGCTAVKLEQETSQQLNRAMAGVKHGSSSGTSLADQATDLTVGTSAAADAASVLQRNMPVARRASAPYIGSVMVPATTEDRLPSIFFEPFTLDFSDAARGGKVPLHVAMARLARLSGVPIRVQSDVTSSPATAGAPAQRIATFPVPSQGQAIPTPSLVNSQAPLPVAAQIDTEAMAAVDAPSITSVEMKYRGTLAGYLNQVTDTLGLAWEYRDNTIVVSRYVNEVHEVFAMFGESKFGMSSAGTGSGGGSGGGGANKTTSSSIDVSEKGEINVMASIVKSINTLVSEVPGSQVTQSEGTGRILVKTSREMQSRVRDFIRGENSAMRRQANIQFDIYSVTTDAGDQRGIDWSVILKKAGESARITLSAPPSLTSTDSAIGSVAIIPNVPGNTISDLLGNSSMFVRALNSQGYSVQHRPLSLLAMNRQWAKLSKMSTDYYLSETTPGTSTATGAGVPGLKTDKVTTGDQYVAMPQILDDNTVLLRFGVSLSDLLGLFDQTVGSGASMQKVQAPKVTGVDVQFPIAIRPGEAVVVTGLSRMVATTDDRRLGEGVSMLLGGSSKVTQRREHFIMFVRPTLVGL